MYNAKNKYQHIHTDKIYNKQVFFLLLTIKKKFCTDIDMPETLQCNNKQYIVFYMSLGTHCHLSLRKHRRRGEIYRPVCTHPVNDTIWAQKDVASPVLTCTVRTDCITSSHIQTVAARGGDERGWRMNRIAQ